MLRLSRLTDYAVVLLVKLGDRRGVTTSTSLAADTGVPEPTVAKVLKVLAGAGLVQSQRGARGGYRIARPLAAIAIGDVVDAVDGPVAVASCVEGGERNCPSEEQCPIRGGWDPVNDAIRSTLSRITLAEMRLRPPVDPSPRADRAGSNKPASASAVVG